MTIDLEFDYSLKRYSLERITKTQERRAALDGVGATLPGQEVWRRYRGPLMGTISEVRQQSRKSRDHNVAWERWAASRTTTWRTGS